MLMEVASPGRRHLESKAPRQRLDLLASEVGRKLEGLAGRLAEKTEDSGVERIC